MSKDIAGVGSGMENAKIVDSDSKVGLLKRIYHRFKRHDHKYDIWFFCKLCGLHKNVISDYERMKYYPPL